MASSPKIKKKERENGEKEQGLKEVRGEKEEGKKSAGNEERVIIWRRGGTKTCGKSKMVGRTSGLYVNPYLLEEAVSLFSTQTVSPGPQ